MTARAWSREQAIAALRRRLTALSDGEMSTCRMATERGIFCRGFKQWNDHEFHERWKAVLGESTHLARPQVERLADLWQLSVQIVEGVRVACDARSGRPRACRGWDEFSNEDLARFCRELLDQPVNVEGRATDEHSSGSNSRRSRLEWRQ